MAAGTTPHEISLLRLVAQRVAGPARDVPTQVVRWLTALQAQDFPGVLTSVALRTPSRDRAAVVAALDAGEVVRSWPMRGTLHLVAVEALAGGGRLRRDDLMAAWQRGGLDTSGQRGYHMLWHVAQTGTVCLGPLDGGEQTVVLVDEWISHQRQPDREEALGTLAERYFRSHGPATVQDFVRWTGLTVTDARTGLATIRPRLASLDVDGVEHLLDPATPDLLAKHREEAHGMFLLPGFDEMILGYADRSATVAPEHAGRIVPGGNGVFRPTVIVGGRAVGTWRHIGRGARRTVTAEPFDAFPAGVEQRIAGAYAALP